MMTKKKEEFLALVRTGLTVYYLDLVVNKQAEEDAAMWVMDRLAAAYSTASRIPKGVPALKAAEDFVEAVRRPEKTPEWLEETVEAPSDKNSSLPMMFP